MACHSVNTMTICQHTASISLMHCQLFRTRIKHRIIKKQDYLSSKNSATTTMFCTTDPSISSAFDPMEMQLWCVICLIHDSICPTCLVKDYGHVHGQTTAWKFRTKFRIEYAYRCTAADTDHRLLSSQCQTTICMSSNQYTNEFLIVVDQKYLK